MLSEFFVAPERIQAIRSGPAGGLVEGFAQELFQRGYAEISARRHIRAAEHLMHWADRRGLSAQDLDDRVLDRFDEHLILLCYKKQAIMRSSSTNLSRRRWTREWKGSRNMCR